MILVNFFATLRSYLHTRQIKVPAEEIRLQALLAYCETKTPKPFLFKLLDEDGHILAGTMILVNGQNVLHLDGLNTLVRDGANIALFPPGGGG
ncbi:MoaD/ThiS family protein [candidate division KSB3 bacterium]|jgi:molybdopterin synthase sulfur carrier subunit|uniref:MoaD/ThiS family protein n=1 Tax=candidate division KSB3 bacterium TaxID=2044937 RepID=A0A9D5Q6C4_9BACT|nr:MoaD/ThiS family protein [candidate division KSB3 bacterium]MBD3325575.1 MoaD/ThiS family protein [candidate division KSB3 bacterium]